MKKLVVISCLLAIFVSVFSYFEARNLRNKIEKLEDRMELNDFDLENSVNSLEEQIKVLEEKDIELSEDIEDIKSEVYY